MDLHKTECTGSCNKLMDGKFSQKGSSLSPTNERWGHYATPQVKGASSRRFQRI